MRSMWRSGVRTALRNRPRSHVGLLENSSTRLLDNYLHYPPSARLYHATQKKEILPLIALGSALLIGRYCYKAWNRMNEEWEEYEWELQQYEALRARSSPESINDSRSIAVDLGSIYTKIAKSYPKPEIVVTREGDRQFFNGIVYKDDDETTIRGRAALEKFFYETENSKEASTVTLLFNAMNGDGQNDVKKIIRDILSPSLSEALDRLDYQSGQQRLRTIVTLPLTFIQSDTHSLFDGLLESNYETVIVPDPVAAVWGSQFQQILPADSAEHMHTFMVVDVGGINTQISVVEKDTVRHSTLLPWGGETIIELAVDLLSKDAPGPVNDARALSAVQVHARHAIWELGSQSQASVHVPYLFADPRNHHLDTKLSRSALELSIKDDIQTHLRGILQDMNLLSTHLAPPNDLTALFTSVITQVLEQSQVLPTDIDYVLLVGGGSKFPLVQQSLQSSIYQFMGSSVNKLVLPEPTLRSELISLGAASMLPSYEYDINAGLRRSKS